MAKIRLALYKLLQASEGPISLAQLPQYIKPYLNCPLDITKLGFTKLKDIILSFGDDFKIEIKSNNYPFVSLKGKAPTHSNSTAYNTIKSNPQQYYSDDFNWANNKAEYCPVIDFNKCINTIRFQILKALQDFQDGIDTITLYSILITQFNNYLNVSQFGCYSFEEFLDRYLSADLELTYNKVTQSCKVKIRVDQINELKPSIHYKFDTYPNFMEKSPQRSQINSLDMSEGSLAGQVTYKFVDQLDV
jgi:OST-HTH/LOTUS domain